VGVAVFPEHGESAEVLLRNADQAMYVSKSRGKSTCTVAEAARPAEN
jgi:GGDEF domain-containing protein